MIDTCPFSLLLAVRHVPSHGTLLPSIFFMVQHSLEWPLVDLILTSPLSHTLFYCDLQFFAPLFG